MEKADREFIEIGMRNNVAEIHILHSSKATHLEKIGKEYGYDTEVILQGSLDFLLFILIIQVLRIYRIFSMEIFQTALIHRERGSKVETFGRNVQGLTRHCVIL